MILLESDTLLEVAVDDFETIGESVISVACDLFVIALEELPCVCGTDDFTNELVSALGELLLVCEFAKPAADVDTG